MVCTDKDPPEDEETPCSQRILLQVWKEDDEKEMQSAAKKEPDESDVERGK